jgi:hypothetical protein
MKGGKQNRSKKSSPKLRLHQPPNPASLANPIPAKPAAMIFIRWVRD